CCAEHIVIRPTHLFAVLMRKYVTRHRTTDAELNSIQPIETHPEEKAETYVDIVWLPDTPPLSSDHVNQFSFEFAHVLKQFPTVKPVFCALGKCHEVLGVSPADGVSLSALLKLFQRILAHSFEHQKARFAICVPDPLQQVFIKERHQNLCDRRVQLLAADCFRCVC